PNAAVSLSRSLVVLEFMIPMIMLSACSVCSRARLRRRAGIAIAVPCRVERGLYTIRRLSSSGAARVAASRKGPLSGRAATRMRRRRLGKALRYAHDFGAHAPKHTAPLVPGDWRELGEILRAQVDGDRGVQAQGAGIVAVTHVQRPPVPG